MQEEITKHSKKLYNEVKNPKHSFGEKVKEIAIEIFIIVFAVTVSIWLHNWSEHRQHQKEVKEFLTDLKEDLKDDVGAMQTKKDKISANLNSFLFLKNVTQQQLDSLDNLKSHYDLNLNAEFTPMTVNNGDYEGFKSSGKIGNIENKKLKRLMLSYYQQSVPVMVEMNKLNATQVLKFMDFFSENMQTEDKAKVILGAKSKAILTMLTLTLKMNGEMYDAMIKNANQIIAEIDKEQGNKTDSKH